MEWLSLAPAVGVCLLVLITPGLLITLGTRVRGFDAVALAPGLSLGVTALTAILASWLGLRWALWIPLVGGLLVGAALLGLRRLLARRDLLDWPRPPRGSAPPVAASWRSRAQGTAWLALLLGTALCLLDLVSAIGDPQGFSQTYDNNFHLNAVRWISETGDASSLTVQQMTSGGQSAGFYPTAWHAVTALALPVAGGSVSAATNAMTLAVGGVVWPLSVVLLVRSMGRFRRGTVLAAGVLSAGCTAFPLLLLWFGILYPNLLGLSVLPAGLAIAVQLLRVSTHRILSTGQAGLLVLPFLAGIALSHPNALMSLLVLSAPILLVRGARQVRAVAAGRIGWGRLLLQLGLIAACLGVLWILWGVVRPADRVLHIWKPEATGPQAIWEAVSMSPMGRYHPEWMVAALVLIGAVSVVRRRRYIWVLLTYLTGAWFYIAVRFLDEAHGRIFITGVWYNDAYRLAALLPVVAVPLAVVGADAVLRVVRHGWEERTWHETRRAHRRAEPGPEALRERQDPDGELPPWVEVPAEGGSAASPSGRGRRRLLHTLSAPGPSTTLLLLAIALSTQLGQPMRTMEQDVRERFTVSADSALVDAQEMDVIEHVDQYVPADQKVLVDPSRGGSLIYALADREVSATHLAYRDDPDAAVLGEKLNQAYSDPSVCEAVESSGYWYVADFPAPALVRNPGHTYPGLEDLVQDGVAEPVYQDGQAQLLRITACGY